MCLYISSKRAAGTIIHHAARVKVGKKRGPTLPKTGELLKRSRELLVSLSAFEKLPATGLDACRPSFLLNLTQGARDTR